MQSPQEKDELEYLRKDYKIKVKIGVGSYGSVYLVKHRTT